VSPRGSGRWHGEGESARLRPRGGLPGTLKRELSRRLSGVAPCCDSLPCFEEAISTRGLRSRQRGRRRSRSGRLWEASAGAAPSMPGS
jgi:hypothetical protein